MYLYIMNIYKYRVVCVCVCVCVCVVVGRTERRNNTSISASERDNPPNAPASPDKGGDASRMSEETR
jgi:hypothetical protein